MAANASDNPVHSFMQRHSGKLIFIVVSIVIVAILVDTSIIRISDLTLKSSSSWIVVLFAVISGVSFIGQNLILRFIKQKVNKSTAVQKSLRLKSIYKVAVTVHYVLAAILVTVILQMIITSRYDVIFLNTAVTISYAFAIIMMGILCHRFFSWFRFDKSYVMFLYGLSCLMLAANACITLGLVNSILIARPGEVVPHTMIHAPVFDIDPVNIAANYAYIITTITSFIITWCATMALLKNYIQKTRKFTYWIVLILPLAYFVSQFLVLYLGLLGPMLITNPIFYGILFTIIFTLSKPIGGVIFGIGFWMIARNIHKDNVVRSYLIISGYGFVLLFASNQAIVLTFTPYPPFGLMTISFVGLASYLVLVGIYSSAISISEDANLRREIRRLAIRESKLLDSIGTAQLEQEIVKKVVTVAKKHSASIIDKTGVQPSLSEDDMKLYMVEVLREIKTSKKEGSFSDEKNTP
jgi:hypothetical protein